MALRRWRRTHHSTRPPRRHCLLRRTAARRRALGPSRLIPTIVPFVSHVEKRSRSNPVSLGSESRNPSRRHGQRSVVALIETVLSVGHFPRDVSLLPLCGRLAALGPLIVAVPLGALELLNGAFALVGKVFALVGDLLAFVSVGVALIGDLIPVVGTPRMACDLGLAPGNGVFARVDVGGPTITSIGARVNLIFSGHDSPYRRDRPIHTIVRSRRTDRL